MSSPITLVKPYKIEKVKDVKDFLIFSKNIMRLIQKQGCFKCQENTQFISIRWSKLNNAWVVDLCTNLYRDILGITKDNVYSFFKESDPFSHAIVYILNSVENNKEIYNIAYENHLIKNETKLLTFKCDFDEADRSKFLVSFLGIFQIKMSKKRKGIETADKLKTFNINSSSVLTENMCQYLDNINPVEYCLLENYNSVYQDFTNYLFNSEIKTNENKIVKFEEFLEDKFLKINNVKKLSVISSSLNKDNIPIIYYDKNKSQVIRYVLSHFLSSYINNYTDTKEDEYAVTWDSNLSYYISFKSHILKTSINDIKEEKVVDSCFLSMIPRTLH